MGSKFTKVNLRLFLILVSNGITLVITAILFLLLYYSASTYMQSMVKSINKSDFDHLTSSIEKKYNEIINISRFIQNNTDLKEMILKFNEGDLDSRISEKIICIDNISDFISSLQNYSSDISSISIVSRKRTFTSNPPFVSADIEKELFNENLGSFSLRYPANVSMLNDMPNEYNIIRSLSNKIYICFGLSDETRYYGNIYILLNNDFFANIADNRKNTLIFDQNGTVLYSSIDASLRRSKLTEEIRQSGTSSMPGDILADKLSNEWTAVTIPDNSMLSSRKETLNKIMIFSSLICFVFSFTISYFLSKNILRPVYSLIQFMFSYDFTKRSSERYSIKTSKKGISLRLKLFYYLIMTILIPVTAFIFLFNAYIVDWSKEQIFIQYNNTFDKAVTYTEGLFYQKAMVFQNIVYSNAIQQYIFSDEEKDAELVIEALKGYRYLGLGNNEISIYSKNNLIFSNYVLTDFESESENKTSNIQDIKNEIIWESGTDSFGNAVFTVSTRVNRFTVQQYREDPVFASVFVPAAEMTEAFKSLQTGTNEVFISDSFGTNIINKTSELILTSEFAGDAGTYETGNGRQHSMVFYERIPKTPWFLVFKYSHEAINNESRSIIISNAYQIVIIMLLIIVLSYLTSMRILKPVNAFNMMLEEYRIDDVNADMLEGSFINEIDSLGSSFNKMIDRLESLFDDLLISNREKNQLQLKMKDAEMVALQAQINPHFLYNTLENLIYLIEGGKKKEAQEVVLSLSRLFRFGISRSDRIISIGEEIAYAKAYSKIISIRYNDAIVFEWDVDESLMSFKTLKLILQPLLENCVLHGFKHLKADCMISVRCHREGNAILFTITDNGQGIPEEVLADIRQELEKEEVEDRVGIFNVQARLRLEYGAEYGINIRNREEGGVVARISIPAIETGRELAG